LVGHEAQHGDRRDTPGVSERALQRLLGYANVESTRLYARLGDELATES
jgi:hypothetical protein